MGDPWDQCLYNIHGDSVATSEGGHWHMTIQHIPPDLHVCLCLRKVGVQRVAQQRRKRPSSLPRAMRTREMGETWL
jgi:hypothetical protein